METETKSPSSGHKLRTFAFGLLSAVFGSGPQANGQALPVDLPDLKLSTYGIVRTMARQADRKILVGGEFTSSQRHSTQEPRAPQSGRHARSFMGTGAQRTSVPGLTYTVEFGSTPAGPWETSFLPGTPNRIGSVWERVVVEADETVTDHPERFARVKVTRP